MEKFVASYKTVQSGLGRPLVVIDISSSPRISPHYLSLVTSLDPRSIHIHSQEAGLSAYDSVQEAVHFGFQRTLEESNARDLILFLEDDIVFSTGFLEKLHSIQMMPDTGFITLYSPGDEYGSLVIDPNRFYGTQCVLFPRKAVEDITINWGDIKSRIPPGYDIRWSRFLSERGYKLYGTDYSYVQHLQGASRLHGHSSHISNRFVA